MDYFVSFAACPNLVIGSTVAVDSWDARLIATRPQLLPVVVEASLLRRSLKRSHQKLVLVSALSKPLSFLGDQCRRHSGPSTRFARAERQKNAVES